jgi:tRNA U34 5-methylaminomethyl-2-thiouridine-forming methyltransferase MnmC
MVLVAAALASASACRQADGPVPNPSAETQEELADVARDLQYIASGTDPAAPKYLESDLSKYPRRASAEPLVVELARRTSAAVSGVKLGEQDAQRLAHNLWLSAVAMEISERQVEGLQDDMRSLLLSMGVPQDRAEQVAVQVGEVQRAVTDRPRRWYEVF